MRSENSNEQFFLIKVVSHTSSNGICPSFRKTFHLRFLKKEYRIIPVKTRCGMNDVSCKRWWCYAFSLVFSEKIASITSSVPPTSFCFTILIGSYKISSHHKCAFLAHRLNPAPGNQLLIDSNNLS
jgi:hypothetical protein